MPLSEDLDQLNTSIRQLQTKWEMFFSGIERKPPSELQRKIEGVIRQYAFQEIRNNTERFRYQSLTARYNTFNELWQKRLRAREEGKAFGVHGLKADVLPPPAPEREHVVPAGGGGTGREFRVASPEGDDAAVRALYDRYVEERERLGEGGAPPYESFRQLIGQQTTKILGDKGAKAVDFRLDSSHGKVSLKARIVK
jgi:hypothetical protein